MTPSSMRRFAEPDDFSVIRQAHRDWINTADAVRDPMMVHDEAGRIVRTNRAYAARAGMTFQQLIGRPYWECFPRRAGPLGDSMQACEVDQEFTLESGEIFVSRACAVADGGRRLVLHLFDDVTRERAAEQRIRTLNQIYATLSAVNHALVHCKTREELCARIPAICTEIGMWRGAWVGFADPQTKRIAPAAWSPSMEPYIGRMLVSVDPMVPEGQGPTSNAIRTGTPYFCDDIFSDPVTVPWRGFAKAFGISTVAAIPLRPKRGACGVVNLYATEKGIFTPEVRSLVVEMGDDITFALDTLESERERLAAELALIDNQARLRRALVATVEAIAATVESRDPYTAGHQVRVAELAAAIAREMQLAPEAVEGIHFGALIHDLGKIQVPAELLSKPTRLSKLELELIKTHPQAGYDVVKGIEFPWPVAAMVHQHHERLDGSGYPQGLKGDAIALEARILAVADVVEAMSSHRPYRPGLGLDAALKEIEEKKGAWFDADAVDACLRLFRTKGFAFAKP